MIDQLIIGDKASFDDFGASVAKRNRKKPKKKTIKETVPFSNVTHDFTKINGEIYWEEAEHEYTFEMDAPTAEQLEEMKTAFSSWVMNIIQEELHDPIIPDYHYIVTYEDMSFADEDELLKTTATVIFSAYPYKVSNYPRRIEIPYDGTTVAMLSFAIESSHRIVPKITADQPISGKFNDERFSMEAGTVEDEFFTLSPKGTFNNISFNSANGTACKVTISFYEEVF